MRYLEKGEVGDGSTASLRGSETQGTKGCLRAPPTVVLVHLDAFVLQRHRGLCGTTTARPSRAQPLGKNGVTKKIIDPMACSLTTGPNLRGQVRAAVGNCRVAVASSGSGVVEAAFTAVNMQTVVVQLR